MSNQKKSFTYIKSEPIKPFNRIKSIYDQSIELIYKTDDGEVRMANRNVITIDRLYKIFNNFALNMSFSQDIINSNILELSDIIRSKRDLCPNGDVSSYDKITDEEYNKEMEEIEQEDSNFPS